MIGCMLFLFQVELSMSIYKRIITVNSKEGKSHMGRSPRLDRYKAFVDESQMATI